MRKLRQLSAGAWYFVSTAVNNREPLFWSALERARFEQVLNEARELRAFALYGLRFSGPTVSFFIKPGDGCQLPEIMQWIKQSYSVRYNVYDGRTGHIWGDRYWSVIVEGPPEDAKEYVFAPVVWPVSRRVRRRRAAGSGGVPASGSPAAIAEGRPRAWEAALNGG
ncbi:MAG: transposase [Spirochaetaceae bacterium]|jgi:REP element-mobilizing transposase RayT|nr:transposase [Spirochaetaceae bacterium]